MKNCIICDSLHNGRGETCSRSCKSKLGQNRNSRLLKCDMCFQMKLISNFSKNQRCQDCKKLYDRKSLRHCNYCNKISYLKKGSLTCSKKCASKLAKHRSIEINVNCFTCGKEFNVNSNYYHESRNYYCSNNCSYIKYKENHSTNRYTTYWFKKRLEILERDHFSCLICESKENLEVHHFIKMSKFSEPILSHYDDNLGTFCRFHHRIIEKSDFQSFSDFVERYSLTSHESVRMT